MVRLRPTLALGLGLAMLGPATAVAAPDGKDTNQWRVHLGGELASWVRQVPWPRYTEGPSGSRDRFRPIGYQRLQLHTGFGRGFRDRFVVGVRLDYEISRGIQRALDPDAEARAITVDAMPYFTFMLEDKNIVRPFVSVRAGLGGGLLTIKDPSPIDRPQRSSSLLYPVLGLDLGAHAFVSHNVSLDGTVSVEHRWEYLRGTTPSMVPEGTRMFEASAGHQSFNRRTVTSIGLAVSRWF